MKKLYTILLVGLFTISCNNTASKSDDSFGVVLNDDEKSLMIQKLFEARFYNHDNHSMTFKKNDPNYLLVE